MKFYKTSIANLLNSFRMWYAGIEEIWQPGYTFKYRE